MIRRYVLLLSGILGLVLFAGQNIQTIDPKNLERSFLQKASRTKQSINVAALVVTIPSTSTTTSTTKVKVTSTTVRPVTTTSTTVNVATTSASTVESTTISKLQWAIASCEGYPRYVNADHPGSSSASGKYGYLDGTWNGYAGFKRAKDAPESVQDERASADLENGTKPWEASKSCWQPKL